MTNPYRVPDDGRPRVLNVSGGQSSGFMAWHVLDAHDGQLPPDTFMAFANTGKECEETLDFVRAMQDHWALPIVWLEYRYRGDAAGGIKDPRHVHEVVDHETAARQGEPFEVMITSRFFLPNPTNRICTSDLKVETLNRWMRREMGYAKYQSVLGIRWDEPDRWKKALMEECRTEYPLVHARITKPDVVRWWRDQPFQLELPENGILGNCDLCFLKGKKKLLHILRKEPWRAEWWIRMEEYRSTNRSYETLENKRMAQFRERWSYRELLDIATRTPELVDVDQGEEGRFDEGSSLIDCYCGDG